MRGIALVLGICAVAGCGDPQVVCGGVGQACCANNACSPGATCKDAVCAAAVMCGSDGIPCCPGGTCTDGTSLCTNGTCVTVKCGGAGQACCSGTTCTTGLNCLAGKCATTGNSGDSCVKDADCAGTKPSCTTMDARGITWPGGYCTSSCNPQKNDSSTTINPGCPGGGSCQGSGATGNCEVACTAMDGALPCARDGYSCFSETTAVCEPTARSQCDPTVKLSCPQDGGAPIVLPPTDGGSDDAGATITSPRSCAKIGDDPVGECVNGCDPLAPQMVMAPSPPCLPTQACYPSYTTGDGECFIIVNGGVGDGAPCIYKNQCNPGLSCHSESNTAFCRFLCGGPGNLACPMGQTCKDISTTVKASQVGLCST